MVVIVAYKKEFHMKCVDMFVIHLRAKLLVASYDHSLIIGIN
jgi:hypothetical protein